jgi:hypothetical protein
MIKRIRRKIKLFLRRKKRWWDSRNKGQKRYMIAFLAIKLFFMLLVMAGLIYIILWLRNR